MKRIRNALILSLVSALLAACGGQSTGPDPSRVALVAVPEGALVASVNGELVTEPMLLVYARGRGLDPAEPAQRKQALDSLVDNVLLAQDGIARGLTDKPEVQAELALVRMQQLSGRSMADYRAQLEITDEQVERYYAQERERAGDIEWQVEHILFDSAAAAEQALARAQQDGVDFADLIAEYQHGALQARRLDWSNASQLPSELVAVLRQLEDGAVAPVTVQTSFGWHVVRRADSRPFEPPALAQVRDGARRQLIERAVAEHVEALRARAEIATGVGPGA
jgi:peptidyl-prolyl cis-trans isomerase C